MIETAQVAPKAILIAVVNAQYDMTSLNELNALVESVGAEVVGEITQNRNTPDNATFVGSGKLVEIKAAVEQIQAGLVVFDNELSPSQLRNIEGFLNVKVMDRSGIILEIFALRAQSAEGKIQVELAQLTYLLPRLRGEGVQLSKLAGGIGTRGPGETQLETDRRHILRKIQFLKKQLQDLKENRQIQQRQRKKNDVPVVALAGYTNAGKSTLMNQMTEADVFAADMLFATLDSTTRKAVLPNGKAILLTDTVGFIKNLPHELIFAFQSTLEEIKQANLILLVADVTSGDFHNQLETVKNTLAELKCTSPIITVYNKADAVETPVFRPKDCVVVSAKTGFGLDNLWNKIQEILSDETLMQLNIPYCDSSVFYQLKSGGKIISESFTEDTIECAIYLKESELYRYQKYIQR